jgi:hypothetical protein
VVSDFSVSLFKRCVLLTFFRKRRKIQRGNLIVAGQTINLKNPPNWISSEMNFKIFLFERRHSKKSGTLRVW